MFILKSGDIPPSEITPRETYLGRRQFMAGMAALAMAPAQRFLLNGSSV